MYEAFFGLRNRPFSPLPRVETYIPLAPVREPFEALVRCVTQEQGIGVLTAPSGAGKSLVCRLLQQRFSEQRRTILLTTARFPTRRALLQAILFELKHPFIGLSEQEARLRLLDLLQASPAPQNRMLLIVDEAHLLSSRGLEELRTLTDYEIAGTPCLSLILSGQLELEELLTAPEMDALNQRVGCHACIEPLTFEESAQYVRERLRYAGNDGLTIFTPDAVQLICSASEGSPRRLNQLSDHSLLLAYAEETRPVDVSIVRSALLDLRELPLHWNAPLDLSWTTERNPLEEFAEAHETDEAEPLDDLFSASDTGSDAEAAAAFETGDQDGADVSESSVFEVGTPLEASSLDQLFEATRFNVPGEPADSHQAPLWFSVVETPHAHESYAYETAPPADIHSTKTASEHEAQDETMFMEPLCAPEFEYGGELVLHAAPQSPALSIASPSPFGFEELVVDDVYAAIDLQLESSQPRWSPPVPVKAREESSIPPVSEMDDTLEVMADTLFEAAPTPVPQESPADFELTLTEVQPMLDENQLLDFINEISVAVRQFSQEAEATRALANPTDPSATSGQEPPRPRNQSLRQSLNWQFDVVEPETGESLPDRACRKSNGESSRESQPAIHGTTAAVAGSSRPDPVSVSPIIEAANEQNTLSERPYAQLFTRLQRQRRRVESVMNRDRQSGTESRLA